MASDTNTPIAVIVSHVQRSNGLVIGVRVYELGEHEDFGICSPRQVRTFYNCYTQEQKEEALRFYLNCMHNKIRLGQQDPFRKIRVAMH